MLCEGTRDNKIDPVYVCVSVCKHSDGWTVWHTDPKFGGSIDLVISQIIFCNPPGWRLQPTRGSRALVSPPLVSSRHRILEPYGRWHVTIRSLFHELSSNSWERILTDQRTVLRNMPSPYFVRPGPCLVHPTVLILSTPYMICHGMKQDTSLLHVPSLCSNNWSISVLHVLHENIGRISTHVNITGHSIGSHMSGMDRFLGIYHF